MITDPIGDMLTRIRNALNARHEVVEMPSSGIKKSIADILVSEGYIKSATLLEQEQRKTLKLELKNASKQAAVITNLRRISRPGLRVYCGYQDLPRVLNGLGIAIISTSKGVMTDKQARLARVGGEVLAYIW